MAASSESMRLCAFSAFQPWVAVCLMSVSPETTARNAISLMLELKTDELAVTDGDRVLGVFRLSDAKQLV